MFHMNDSPSLPQLRALHRGNPGRRLWVALWPRWPLAAVLALVGVLNVLDGLSLPLKLVHQLRALSSLAESLSAVGGTAQVILGSMLVATGLGLLRRLSFAWALAVLLLIITVVVNVARHRWGLSLGLQGGLLVVMLLVKRYFTRRTVLASLVFSLSSIVAILAYGAFGSYILGSGFRPEIQNLNTALYYTIVTLSTVGYGDIVPVTTEARWFAVSLLVIGLGVFATAIASAVGPKISTELNRLFTPPEKPMDLKEHIILVGEGAIASNTAQELRQRGVEFVQIVTSKGEAPLNHERAIEGDATNDAVLQEAGIKHARLVIAAREDDGENAFIALGAKDLNPNVRVLAVASSALSIRRLKLARADLVFSPAAVGSRLLADLAEGKDLLPEFRDLLGGDSRKI